MKTSARVWVPRVKIYDLYQLVRPVTTIHNSQIVLGRHRYKWKYFLSHRCRPQETLVEGSCGVCVNVWAMTASSFKLCWPWFLTASLGLRPCFSDIWDEIANYIPFRNLQRCSNLKKNVCKQLRRFLIGWQSQIHRGCGSQGLLLFTVISTMSHAGAVWAQVGPRNTVTKATHRMEWKNIF